MDHEVRRIPVAADRIVELHLAGPEDGRVLLFHHGTPGAGLPEEGMVSAAAARGLRYASFTRPGYGGSTRRPGRAVASVADGVTAVLDHLGVQGCLTLGWSGGGPHALATAALLPERVQACGVIAGVAPDQAEGLDFLAGMGELNVVEFTAARAGEGVLRPLLDEWAPGLRSADAAAIVAELASVLPAVDQALLTDDYGRSVAAAFHEALRDGVDGWVDDDLAFSRPWGFGLGAIAPPVSLWQGDADLMVPFAHGEWLAAHLPGARVHLLPGEGHLSIGVGRIEEILDDLLAAAAWA